MYSCLAVARAALEAFGWSRWLADPDIGPESRVKRSMALRLHDMKERRRFPDPTMGPLVQTIDDWLTKIADHMGWHVRRNPKPPRRYRVDD